MIVSYVVFIYNQLKNGSVFNTSPNRNDVLRTVETSLGEIRPVPNDKQPYSYSLSKDNPI